MLAWFGWQVGDERRCCGVFGCMMKRVDVKTKSTQPKLLAKTLSLSLSLSLSQKPSSWPKPPIPLYLSLSGSLHVENQNGMLHTTGFKHKWGKALGT